MIQPASQASVIDDIEAEWPLDYTDNLKSRNLMIDDMSAVSHNTFVPGISSNNIDDNP